MLPVLVLVATLAIWVFVVTTAASMGLGLTARELLAPFKKIRLLSVALIVNFLVIPLLALCILRILPLEPGLAAGLLIVATAAGAPSLPKTIEIIGGDIAYAVEITLVLVLVTIVYMPIVLPLLMSGIQVDQVATALYLLVFMLLPLVVCMIVRARKPDLAESLYPDESGCHLPIAPGLSAIFRCREAPICNQYVSLPPVAKAHGRCCQRTP